MRQELPRITLVTPSFNQASFLEATIRSVLDQAYPDLEYIVIDGGSTDGSVEIIRKYEDRLAFWTSQRDKGQTDAIGRGFSRATGEIMNWLNSDDLLAPGALSHIAQLAEATPRAAILAAATESFVDGHFNGLRVKSIPTNLTVDGFLFRNGLPVQRHQPGIFFRRDPYERIGGFQNNYHICMDVDLHLRMVAAGGEVAYSERTVAFFRRHEASKTQGGSVPNALQAVREYMAICESVGAQTGLRPNHRAAHWRTLLGSARSALFRGRGVELAKVACLGIRVAILGR